MAITSRVTKKISSPVTKRNPRPRKYASQADRQAAYRARNVMLEFRAEPKTADNITRISETLGYPRSDVLLSMVKFALTNHDWARFGLTHKTIPTYKENPMREKTFLMSIGASKPKVETPYDFSFTHYIPQNSYGGSKVAFKFYAHEDGTLTAISEAESGKRVGVMDTLDRIKYGPKIAAKKAIEKILQRYGATKVYEVLTKG
jgi:hypothetical protein